MTTDFKRLAEEGKKFRAEVDRQLQLFLKSDNPLVRVDVEGGLFDIYLENIPEDYNPIFRVRRYFDGNYDKNYIRRIGSIAMITPEKELVSLWDFETDTFFKESVNRMSEAVHNGRVTNKFLEKEKIVGHKPNKDTHDPNITWEHFYVELPKEVVDTRYLEERLGEYLDAFKVLRRTVNEVNIEDLGTVIDLVEDNAIYRGTEFLRPLRDWVNLKKDFDKNPTENYIWYEAIKNKRKRAYRNTVIGSLITDLYDGVELEKAVGSFEAKVAPSNYKRPKSIVTAKMVEEAKQKLEELGLLDSIYRRAAKVTDIPATKILFTSQERKAMSVFDDLTNDANSSTKKVDSDTAREMTITELLVSLPEISKIELLPTFSLTANKVVLTAPLHGEAESIFKWNNKLSWAYINSDTTDAIAQRVKDAGGNIDADFRVSLSWDNRDDLDLKVNNIYFGRTKSDGGVLDVDANFCKIVENPVENIYWKDINKMKDGIYRVSVHNYTKRSNDNQGFSIQIATPNSTTVYTYPNNDLRNGWVEFITLVKKGNSITVTNLNDNLKEQSMVKAGDNFINVKHVLLSPNMWDEEIGNKHILLLTDDVEVDSPVRGFFNEQLNSKLEAHRKVTEILGSKLKISASEFEGDGIAKGYGFSSTLDNNFILRLTYNNNRKELVHVSVK